MDDFAYANIPTPDVCSTCHETQVEQFSKGKHAMAWTAMKAMPTIHHQPTALIEGMKGCGWCHKIGLKSETEIAQILQADAVVYQDLEDLITIGRKMNPQITRFETSIFDGKYVTSGVNASYLTHLAQARKDSVKITT